MSEIRTIHTDEAPAAIGPYAQAVTVDGWLYASGQIPLDPVSMELITGSVASQTEQVFANLRAVLAAAGASLDRVVKTTVFLADMADFAEMNEVYARHFADHRPARATIQAAGLPRGVSVEIELVARLAG